MGEKLKMHESEGNSDTATSGYWIFSTYWNESPIGYCIEKYSWEFELKLHKLTFMCLQMWNWSGTHSMRVPLPNGFWDSTCISNGKQHFPTAIISCVTRCVKLEHLNVHQVLIVTSWAQLFFTICQKCFYASLPHVCLSLVAAEKHMLYCISNYVWPLWNVSFCVLWPLGMTKSPLFLLLALLAVMGTAYPTEDTDSTVSGASKMLYNPMSLAMVINELAMQRMELENRLNDEVFFFSIKRHRKRNMHLHKVLLVKITKKWPTIT